MFIIFKVKCNNVYNWSFIQLNLNNISGNRELNKNVNI